MVYPYNSSFNLQLGDFQVRDSSLWETKGKDRAAPGVIFSRNRPALPRDNHLAERQSNPVSGGALVFATIKAVKQVG